MCHGNSVLIDRASAFCILNKLLKFNNGLFNDGFNDEFNARFNDGFS